MSEVEGGALEPPITYSFETSAGNEIRLSFSYDAAQEIISWSTSEALLKLGDHAPQIQSALRRVFGE